MTFSGGLTAGEPEDQGAERQQTPQKKEAHTELEAAAAAGPLGGLAEDKAPFAGRHSVAASQHEGLRRRSVGLLTGWNRREVMSCRCPTEAPQRRVSKRRRIPEGGERCGPVPACTVRGSQCDVEEEEGGGMNPEDDTGSC